MVCGPRAVPQWTGDARSVPGPPTARVSRQPAFFAGSVREECGLARVSDAIVRDGTPGTVVYYHFLCPSLVINSSARV
jgi:hypothetical protein